jgi:hypothetical protein
MKKCKKCNEDKQFSDFPKKSDSKDGFHSLCKVCINLRNKQYRDKNKIKFKIARKKYYSLNREKLLKEKRKYSKKTKDKKAIYDLDYRQNNKQKIQQHKRNWENKNKNNPLHKIKRNLRRRVHHAIKDNYKSAATFELIGCSAEQFKIYLESLFLENMSWDNYGSEWHIDHIIPCCNFDLSKEEEQRKCFHYTNQQPLWVKDNLKKAKRIIVK